MRQLTVDGAKFIATFEGFRSHAYRDVVGVWTIGYGHTHGVGPATPPITQATALELLRKDAADAAAAICTLVKVPLNNCEFDALVSLVYNIGAGGFASSTVLRELNKGHRRRAGLAFLMWVRGGGLILPGLVRRRHAERRLFRGHTRVSCGQRRKP